MKDLYTLDEIPDTMRDHIYMKILSLAEYAALSKPEQVAYDQSLKNMRDYNAAMSYQKELGWEEGKLKGRNETVKLFHKNGMSIDEIQRYTGLSLEEIEGILG